MKFCGRQEKLTSFFWPNKHFLFSFFWEGFGILFSI